MALAKCQKFTANIYDKNRCKNCYRPKESHSEAALEKNKVSRKISKCGYLFVAPDTFDFSSPLDKTRRWQRRFFVLYDDGELSYSVDENVNTVPQGIIDMNKCCDVYDAENATSHVHSIAVETPDKVTYIKGGTKEESHRWHDVLVMYPRSTKTKHKRSPTFPPTRAASLDTSLPISLNTNQVGHPGKADTTDTSSLSVSLNAGDPLPAKRHRFLSVGVPTTLESMAEKESHMYGDLGRGVGGCSKGSVVQPARTSLSMASPPEGSRTNGHLWNGEVISSASYSASTTSAAISRPSSEQPQPLTYRGVRSLKHRHDKSYTDGIRKSNSLQDLTSSPVMPSEDLSSFGEMPFRSHSKENLSGIFPSQVVSDNVSGLRAMFNTRTDVESLSGTSDSGKPKTFFEFLVTEPAKPQPKNGRYLRLAGIPQTKSIEDYSPFEEQTRVRRKSVPTTDLERMEANKVVASTAKFWEAQSNENSEGSSPKSRTPSPASKSTRLSSKSSPSLSQNRSPSPHSPPTRNQKIPASRSRSIGNMAARPVSPPSKKSPPQNLIKKRQPLHSPKTTAPCNRSKNLTSTPQVTAHPSKSNTLSNKISPIPKTSRSTTVTNPASVTSSIPTSTSPSARLRSRITRKPNSTMSQENDLHPEKSSCNPSTSTPLRPLPPWNSPRSIVRMTSHPEGSTRTASSRSRSPAGTLLLNGHSKNETDERKMAKSDYGSTHVNEEVSSLDHSPSRVSAVSASDESHTVHNPQQDLEYMKKGWLVKQGVSDKDWKKYWFVLSGSTLKYFEDMEAERLGLGAGSINLSACFDMTEVSVSRKYGFQLKTRQGNHVLSALTLGIRKNWMQAIGQCININGGSYSSSPSVSSREGSPHNSRRMGERYHTHSGAFSTNSSHSIQPPSPADSSVQLHRGYTEPLSQRPESSEVSRPERPAYSVRRSGSEEVTVTTPTGVTETVRMRSRRRTTDNVMKLPESTPSPSKYGGCTWPYENPKAVPHRENSQRDLSQYLDEDEKEMDLSLKEEQELDNVQRNIRNIHRRSLTDHTQFAKPRHFEKFESGSAFSGSPERQPSSERLSRPGSRDSSSSSTRFSSRDSSNQSSPARSRGPSFDRQLNDSSPSRLPSSHKAPSAKIKDKSKIKSGRVKSPPPEKLGSDEDFLDSFVRVNLEVQKDDVNKSPKVPNELVEDKWKDVEKYKRMKGSSDNGDALVDLLEAEVESLKTQLEFTQGQLDEVQEVNSDLKMEMRRNRKECSEYLNDVELDQTRYMSQIEDYHIQIEQTEAMRKQLCEKDESLNKTQRDYLQKVKSMEDDFHREKEHLQRKVEQLEAHIEHMVKQSSIADTLNTNMADILKEKDETIAQLEEKVIENESRMEDMCEELKLEVEENTKLQHSADDLNVENQQLHKRVGDMQGELNDMEEEYNKLMEEVRDLGRQLSEKATEKQLLSKDLERVEQQAKELVQENKSLKESLDQTSEELTNKTNMLSSYDSQAMAKETDFYQLKQSHEQICEELEQTRSECDQLTMEYEKQAMDVESLEKLNTESLRELEELRKGYKGALNGLGESENLVTDLRASLDAAECEIVNKKLQLSNVSEEMLKYKSKYEQQHNELEELQSVKQQLTQKLESEHMNYQEEMESKYHELAESQKLLDELQEKLHQTEGVMQEESQFLASLSKSAVMDRVNSAHSSPRSECSSTSDIPKSYDDLKNTHKKLLSENRSQKRQIQELNIRCDEAESNNLSFKQQLKNLEVGYRDQVDNLGSKVQDLTGQLSNMEKKNKRLERRTRTQEINLMVDAELQVDLVESVLPKESLEVQQRAQELQGELDLSDTKVNQLMNRLIHQRSLEVELDLLHQQLETLEAENKKMKDEVQVNYDEFSKDRNLPGQLRELQLKIKQGVGLLEDCSKKLSDTIIDMDDSSMHDSLASTYSASSTKNKLQSALVMLKDAKALLPHPRDKLDAQTVNEEIKLRLFAERLATEAVVLGEMSYLVRSNHNSQDDQLSSLYAFKAKVKEITAFMSEHYCNESADVSMSERDSLSSYTVLLADKLRIQSQLLVTMDEVKSLASDNVDVFVTDDKSMQDVARSSLGQSSLSAKLVSATPCPPHLGLYSGMSHAAARSDLVCVFNNLKQVIHSGSSSSSSNHTSIGAESAQICHQLAEESSSLQEKLVPVIEERVKDISELLYKCDKCGSSSAEQNYMDVFSKELAHVTHKYLGVRGVCNGANNSNSGSDTFYCERFSEHLNVTADKHINKTLQDIEQCCKQITSSPCNEGEDSEQEMWEKERTSLLLQLGFIIAQLSLVQALSSYFLQSLDLKTTSESSGANDLERDPAAISLPELFPSAHEQRDQVATMLAQGAASRNALASFLLNNTARGERNNMDTHSWQEQISNLATQLVETDMKISKQGHTTPDYQGLITKEAVTQAQLSYLHYCLKLKHQAALQQLQVELESSKMVNQAEQEGHVQNMEEQLEQMNAELEELQNERDAAVQQEQQVMTDLQSELERKENIFRQEVQAIKDGYEIRIRSLQRDLDVAKNDLDKIQQEKEMEGQHFEESLNFSVRGYENEIEKINSEKELEISTYQDKIADLEVEISSLKEQYRKEVDLNRSQANASINSSFTADGSTQVSSGNAEQIQQKMGEVAVLRQQLEQEKKKHLGELGRLQEALQGDSDTAAQALLTSKIQQLQEQILNMQHDYEQELSIQKAAHRRELARSKDDMMHLLATAEAKSTHIDQEVVNKKYIKELDKIKTMYDRSFGAMEKSHQKVIMQMRKAHKRELDLLRLEKDQVLAEETKATQAALDAMRKAHEAELQKERNKFLDVIAKTYSHADVETLQKQHEADLDLIQGELKDLSEEYTLRCLEKASMEERLESQAKTLHQSRKRIQDLMASREEVVTRNKHEIEKFKRQLFGGSTTSAGPDGQSTQLKVKDVEINQLNDEINMLKDQLCGTTEELEESMDKYHELHSVHNVAKQRHRRELEELRRQVQENSHMEMLLSEGESSVESSESHTDNQDQFGHSSRWTVINSDIMTSTPFKEAELHFPTKHPDLQNDPVEVGGQGSTIAEPSPRKLPMVTPEMRTAKKSLWRQKQPQRARSNPGLTGSVTLTLQKQFSAEHSTPAMTFDPKQAPPKILKPSVSFDTGVASVQEEV